MISTGNQLPSHFTDEEMEALARSMIVTDDNKSYFLWTTACGARSPLCGWESEGLKLAQVTLVIYGNIKAHGFYHVLI